MNRPVALVCYICGREFGTKSLAIHIKSCQKKWENEQNLKPPRERRPCPQPPRGLNEMLDKDTITKQDIAKMNSGAFDTYMEEALIQCEYCGRKFNPTSLKPHQKACKISPMLKKPGKAAQQPEVDEQPIKVPQKGYNLEAAQFQQGASNQVLEECYKCGRKFANDRIQKHEKVCKGEGIKLQQKQPPKPPPKKPQQKGPEKDPKWKVQHQEFQNAIKQARMIKQIQAKGGKLSDLPPPPRSNYDHYVQCQYCGRKYAEEVAARHIPKCKDIINKPGGIKPSTIGQKYIAGTGAQKPKPPSGSTYQMTAPTKPQVSVVSSNLRTSSNAMGGTAASTGLGTRPTQTKPSVGYGTSNQQYGKLFKK